MFNYIQGETANDVWIKAFDSVMKSSDVNSRVGCAREVLHAALSINNPIQRWISQKNPPISISYALADFIWTMSGSNDATIINYWNPSLHKFSGSYSNYPGAYGDRIIHRYGINQLEKVYDTLKNNPESRQAVILIWDPRTDLPQIKGEPNNEDIPCNLCSMVKVRNNRLEWTQIMRSNDLVLGFPYDIVLFTSLQEVLSSWLHLEVGSYNHISDSLHIYNDKVDKIGIVSNNLYNSDSLRVEHDDYRNVIDMIFYNMKRISKEDDLSSEDLVLISKMDTGYESYNNILKILCAYAANKKQATSIRDKIVTSCTNIAFTEMWNTWLNHYGGGK